MFRGKSTKSVELLGRILIS